MQGALAWCHRLYELYNATTKEPRMLINELIWCGFVVIVNLMWHLINISTVPSKHVCKAHLPGAIDYVVYIMLHVCADIR